MAYKVIIPRKAEKSMRALPRSVYLRVRSAVDGLEVNPRPHGAKKLRGKVDTWRVRVGTYRILYTIEDDRLVVLVVGAGHRRTVYRSV